MTTSGVAALDKQRHYSRLLNWVGFGTAIYIPKRNINVGDVAYFQGPQYCPLFNVFRLTPEVFENFPSDVV